MHAQVCVYTCIIGVSSGFLKEHPVAGLIFTLLYYLFFYLFTVKDKVFFIYWTLTHDDFILYKINLTFFWTT